MPEVKTIMTPIQVDMACECIVGMMRPTGVARLSNPPQYEHRCDMCGNKDFFEKNYPHVIYKPSDEIEVD